MPVPPGQTPSAATSQVLITLENILDLVILRGFNMVKTSCTFWLVVGYTCSSQSFPSTIIVNSVEQETDRAVIEHAGMKGG